MDKREEISKELLSRLVTLDPLPVALIEGNGGIWGNWGRNIPVVHVYEQATEDDIVKRGMYQIVLPIMVQYIIRLNDKSKIYTEGRAKLRQLISVIEQDERFFSRWVEKELVIDYYRTTSEIADIMDGVLGVGVVYNFIYAEPFEGYECYRPHFPRKP